MDNEKLLIEKAINGDVEAFEILIDSYQKKVYNLAFRMMGNYHDASELAQEVFIKIFQKISKFRGESSFSTWVYRVASNTCLDELRKRKKSKLVYMDEEVNLEENKIKKQLDVDINTPETEMERKEIREVIKQSVTKLPEKLRIAVILRDIQGFSYEEIAEHLVCSKGTVKSRINRGRQKLKEFLKNRELISNESVYISERRRKDEKV